MSRAGSAAEAPARPRPPASAAQLEVARRLALRSDPGAPDQAAAQTLVDLVLETPVGGRGQVDRPEGAAGGVPDRELLRVCLAVLARFCEEEPPDAAPTTSTRARRRPFRRRRRPIPLRVVGSSPQADRVRRALTDRGEDDDPGRPVLVVAGALDAMALGLWRQRVDAGSGVRWRRLWDGFAARDRLPDALDPAAVARRWAERVGAAKVSVLVARHDEDDEGTVGDVVGDALPVEQGELLVSSLAVTPSQVDAVDTDLLRRLNQLLASRPEPVRRRPYDGVLAARFEHPWDGSPAVPEQVEDWARGRAERLAHAVADLPEDGVRVVGDPAVLVPARDYRPRGVPVSAALERALDLLTTQFRGGDPWRAR